MELERTLEAILFAAGDPVKLVKLAAVTGHDEYSCSAACDRLADRYADENRGMRVLRVGAAYQMVSAPEHAALIRLALEERKPPPLSKPALEVLAIVAYHQPTTRTTIENIRGVDSLNSIGTLMDKGLIEECGRLEVPGRPYLYRTTANFLRCFGLTSLDRLPLLPGGEDMDGQLTL